MMHTHVFQCCFDVTRKQICIVCVLCVHVSVYEVLSLDSEPPRWMLALSIGGGYGFVLYIYNNKRLRNFFFDRK